MRILLARFVLLFGIILLCGYGRGYAHVLSDSGLHYHATQAQDNARSAGVYAMHYQVINTPTPATGQHHNLICTTDNVTEYEQDDLVVFEKQLEATNYFTAVFCVPATRGSCPPVHSSPHHFSNSTSYRYLALCVIRI